MKIDILTIFPEMFVGPLSESILKRAQEKKLVEIKTHNLRDWASDKHKTVDSSPYGGGPGMVMRVDVIAKALNDLKLKAGKKPTIILLDTKGKLFTQFDAKRLSNEDNLIFIAGHYEGLDHRVHEHFVDEVFSIGNYVLTGGELPTMVIVDAVTRLIPGVLGNEESLTEESFNKDTDIEYPQYTRPEEFEGHKVPEVLLSGDHAKIKKWRESKTKK